MLDSGGTSLRSDINTTVARRWEQASRPVKRSQSASPNNLNARRQNVQKKLIAGKRHRSMSPTNVAKKAEDKLRPASPVHLHTEDDYANITLTETEKDVLLPPTVISKTMRSYAGKRREFIKLRKNVISQQNMLIETYASLKEIEARCGINDNNLGDLRLLSISGWQANDLLVLLRNDIASLQSMEINEGFGPQMLRRLHSLLSVIPDEVRAVNSEIMIRRNEILQLWRSKSRPERLSMHANTEWKNKNAEFESQTENIKKLVVSLTDNIKTKIKQSFDVAKMPWIDRENLIKKVERLQNENLILQDKLEEKSKKDGEGQEVGKAEDLSKYEALQEQLNKEKSAKESLREIVSTAESMLRVARSRIVNLEKQVKEGKTELDAAKRKQKELEQLYRHRELSYDTRSKKLIELSKTGEMTIEALSQQRDALELRVKELREQLEITENAVSEREAKQRNRADTLQAKLTEKEKAQAEAEMRATALQDRVKDLEKQLSVIQERCTKLLNIEKEHCLDYLPSKEGEPSDGETEIWKELQDTRAALVRVEEELRQTRTDKDNFLNSLSRIAQIEGDNDNKMATELLDREQRIAKLQSIIDEQRANEKIMEQSMSEYETQLAALRLEVKRLRNYDCYSRDTPYQDLRTELLEMQMQVATLSRERSALVTAAASRALMLERYERAADMFAKVTRARRDLAAQLEGQQEPKEFDGATTSQVVSSLCQDANDTWSALQTERARVLQLESAILMQSLQLEREGKVRTQLERRKAMLERQILRLVGPGSQNTLLSDQSL
ncbi:PREDICTED: cingulin-like [Papilio xuthus]|uniref:Cingulin-like n=1 Tax=Papilio xuthus TaxID=66420 RepID=A0AAJ7EF70_PAPXU|nr:PREDICTED: cingulin-like [Papilio xuthus]